MVSGRAATLHGWECGAENGTGAVIAVIVATVILPVSTYSVIRTGLHGYLQSLRTFVDDLGGHLTGPDVRIRSDVRAVDHALFQIKDAESHLLPPFSFHSNGRTARRYRRAKALTDILSSATRAPIDEILDMQPGPGAGCLCVARRSGRSPWR
jgi:hypothetical protein